ncbi:YIP1 family protein [Bacillus sp. UMB0899]|uniref:Yip1 family protein n=1 Tax=Metabacillus schmidteae TaxID=2730405 RepID=UPI000C7FAE56|nr:Yip1 family protein [Metabacillus schmidteae]PMC35144.1 YIP1 family protein [Bacillus sp. UMB0899]
MEQETVQSKKPSLFGMIFQPGEQFERMREKPVIWLPLIILSILGAVVGVLAGLNVDYATVPGMEGMPAEQIEMSKMFGVIFGGIGALFGTPIGFVIFAAILFGITKIAKSPITFKQMFSLILFTSFISTIGQVLNQLIIYAIGSDPTVMLTSINSFIGAEGVMGGVLSTIEVFNIWYYILLGIGLVKVAQISKPAAYTITIIFFALGLIVAVVSGALEGLAQF